MQKLLLEDLERAETRCQELVDADKEAAVLREKLKADRAMEIMFAVGVGVGCLMVGAAPSFWTTQPQGGLLLTLGAILTIGSGIARAVRR